MVFITAEIGINHNGDIEIAKKMIVVAKTANAHDIPVIGISGSLGKGFQEVHQHGICASIAITQKPMTLDEASANASDLIADATEQAIRILTTGERINRTAR